MTHIEMGNSKGDDSVNHRTRLVASNDVCKVSWTLPDRLTANAELLVTILNELVAELKERTELRERTGR